MITQKIASIAVAAILAGTFIGGCNTSKEETMQQPAEIVTYYGDSISLDGAVVPVADLDDMLAGKDSLLVKVSGTIEECCKKKGCFMTLKMDNGSLLTVRFKDYGFFVPKDADGHEAIFEGVARREVIDVETLQHYASDKGASQEEIDAITEPEESITFEAHGVIIKGYEPKKAS